MKVFFCLAYKEVFVPSTPPSASGALVAVAALVATKSTYLQHERGGQGLIAGTNVVDCGVLQLSGPGPDPVYLNLCWQSYTHYTR